MAGENKKWNKELLMSALFTFIVVILFISIYFIPVFAQTGKLGQNPTYPNLPQREQTPDYLLVGKVKVTVDPNSKEATLQFSTSTPTPNTRICFGVYNPQEEIKMPQYYLYANENSPEETTTHIVTLNLTQFEDPQYDIYNFTDNGGVISYRIEIYNPKKASSTFYEGRFRVDGNYNRIPCIIEGPFVDITKNDSAIISFETDMPTTPSVLLNNNATYAINVSDTHFEIPITNISQNTEYKYDIIINGVKDIKTYHFKTAPTSEDSNFRFVVMSDSGGGVGSGELGYAGGTVNYHTLNSFMLDAYNKGADFILFGGDLVNGYTTNSDDYRMQLEAWKYVSDKIGCYIPIYECMGNHEALMDIYEDGSKYGIDFDKQDDNGSKSSETIFAEEFVNPTDNFPENENTLAPSYKENAYYFDYGNTRFIVYNTNYWYSIRPEEFGGNLEGYVMDKQFEWIKKVLNDSKNDSSIKHIFILGHQPLFSNDGTLGPEYLIKRRYELWEAISQNSKVVAVLAGHEHNYNRMFITNETHLYPDNSTDANFTKPVWQITTGGAGAPLYGTEGMPWSEDIKHFYFGKNYCIIEIKGGNVYLKIIDVSGNVVDNCTLR